MDKATSEVVNYFEELDGQQRLGVTKQWGFEARYRDTLALSQPVLLVARGLKPYLFRTPP